MFNDVVYCFVFLHGKLNTSASRL